ncbi:MAG: TetR/AcrR family transcriptional regulator C-terminal domain-containing protein [Lachnospiraceae bacterium]
MTLRSTEHTLRRCMRKLMRERYLKNITIADICGMAKIGKRTFYRYYTDKYALFEDTYRKEFYEKLDIDNDTYLYDIYERILCQMYDEPDFFRHAIAIKEQNGFWEIVEELILPLVESKLTSDPYIDKAKEFYIRKDIQVVLHLMEEWILGGYKETPQEVSQFLRLCNAIHGKWEYQVAMNNEPDEYSLEKFKNNEW